MGVLVIHKHILLIGQFSEVLQFMLTLSLPNKLSTAKFCVCFNLQSASMVLIVCENVVLVSNSLDPDEKPSYSASHSDPSCLHMALELAG